LPSLRREDPPLGMDLSLGIDPEWVSLP